MKKSVLILAFLFAVCALRAQEIGEMYGIDHGKKIIVATGSLFDGIGGFPLCFERCGAKAVWASEIEEFPIAVTKKHFPENNEDWSD